MFHRPLVMWLLVAGLVAAEAPSPARPATTDDLAATPEGRRLLAQWQGAHGRFTPELRAAWLRYRREEVHHLLAARGREIPPEFLDWIDGTPGVAATVYGARQDAAAVVQLLYSLEWDLGREVLRGPGLQLALAMAVVRAREGWDADLTAREPLRLRIPGCPLRRVDTRDPHRVLDRNDHLINFLEDHAVTGPAAELPWLHREVSDLVYDEEGEAAPNAAANAVTTPRQAGAARRPLTAAEVLSRRDLQRELQDYLQAKGFPVVLDCGDHLLWPDRHAMVGRSDLPRLRAGFQLFKEAYEAKGLLPAARDPRPTPAERCAFLLRNQGLMGTAKPLAKPLPLASLAGPWPVLTLLAADEQPLREVQDLWERFHDRGEVHLYGEYIGDIAQQFDMQSARRLCPYEFAYDTVQMMLKDGGVCGTMAKIQSRTFSALGIPSCTAGQPGHCALISFVQPPGGTAWSCEGFQFVTAGPEGTNPHQPWFFADVDARRDMVYHQAMAWGVNADAAGLVEALLIHQFHRALPPDERAGPGSVLLRQELQANPYALWAAESAGDSVGSPQDVVELWTAFKGALAGVARRPGCPADPLYVTTVGRLVLGRLGEIPVATDRARAAAILALLRGEPSTPAPALARYQAAVEGVAALLARTEQGWRDHLALLRTDDGARWQEQALLAAAGFLTDPRRREDWLRARAAAAAGRSLYLDGRGHVASDPAIRALAKALHQREEPEESARASLQERFVEAVRLQGRRSLPESKLLAKGVGAVAETFPDPPSCRAWLKRLDAIVHGTAVRDPVAEAIAKRLKTTP